MANVSQTRANLLDILRETFTADRLARMFYDKTPWLDQLQKTSKYTIGKTAKVPLHTHLGGGDTILSNAGGTINPSDPEDVKTAEFPIAYDWRQIQIEFGALNEASGGLASVAEAKALEIESKVLACNKSMQRQYLSKGDALLVQCGTTSASTTVTLSSTDGPNVVQRAWLRPGQVVDIGTTSSEASVAADQLISAVNKTAGTITIPTSVTTSSSHYVSIANARSGSTSNESLGLLGIAGDASLVVGGIDPSTDPYWAPASVDSTSTSISVDVPLDLQRAVYQETGVMPAQVLTSIKQLTNLYKILQVQERFSGDMVESGGVLSTKWRGMTIDAYPDILDRLWFMFNPQDLLIVHGKYSGPTWASQVQGSVTGMIYNQGSTNFGDSLVCAAGLGCRDRRSTAAATNLTA